MIRNQRLGSQEGSADALTLNTEYPFEKYLLPGSDKYVDSLLVDKPIGRVDSLYDSDQVMEELLSESPRVGGFMHHFLGWWPSIFLVCYFIPFFSFNAFSPITCLTLDSRFSHFLWKEMRRHEMFPSMNDCVIFFAGYQN